MEMLKPHLQKRVFIQNIPRYIKLRIKDICNIQDDQEVADPERTSGR